MRLTQIFKQIEDVHFVARFTVIDNFRILLRALEENEIVSTLIELSKNNASHRGAVLHRLYRIAGQKCDPNLQHPDDIVLMAYLFVLYKTDPVLASGVAKSLPSLLPNLWWAKRLAAEIQEHAEEAVAPTITATLDDVWSEHLDSALLKSEQTSTSPELNDELVYMPLKDVLNALRTAGPQPLARKRWVLNFPTQQEVEKVRITTNQASLSENVTKEKIS